MDGMNKKTSHTLKNKRQKVTNKQNNNRIFIMYANNAIYLNI